MVHRYAWAVANGPIPDGMCVCHRCDVRLCVNPAHMFIGTQADNMRDMVQKGRSAHNELTPAPRGAAHPLARLTEDAVRVIRQRHAEGLVSERALGREYGVSRNTISDVAHRRTWTHVA